MSKFFYYRFRIIESSVPSTQCQVDPSLNQIKFVLEALDTHEYILPSMHWIKGKILHRVSCTPSSNLFGHAKNVSKINSVYDRAFLLSASSSVFPVVM